MLPSKPSLAPSILTSSFSRIYNPFLNIDWCGDYTAQGKYKQYPLFAVKTLREKRETVYKIFSSISYSISCWVCTGTAWVAGEVGNAIPESYTLIHRRSGSGGNFLAEVQAFTTKLNNHSRSIMPNNYTATNVFSNVVSRMFSSSEVIYHRSPS
jgi:hypothetical protein